MDEILINTLGSLQDEFQTNELAFLALTTKIELPLRDRWAFRLFRDLSGKHVVARESRRTDLAVLDNGEPEALIELKAMYTFDAALDQLGVGGYCDAMDKDEKKALALAGGSGSVYPVLLATHPKQFIVPRLERVVKYRPHINRAIETFGSEKKVARSAQTAVDEHLSNKEVIAKGALPCGAAYEIPTEVYYWLVKAKQATVM